MPKVKERDQTNKVKSKGKKKGGGTVQRQAQHVMTAKLKKELVQRKQSGASSAAEIAHDNITDTTKAITSATGSTSADSNTGAVEQVEQTTQAAAVEMGHYAKRGISMAVSKVKQNRLKIKERQPDTQGQPPDTSAPTSGTHGTDTPADTPAHPGRTAEAPAVHQPPAPGDRMRQRAIDQRKGRPAHPKADTAQRREGPAPVYPRTDTPIHHGQAADISASPQAHTPGDRMRQRAVNQRREQFTHPKPDTTTWGEAPASPHYGGTPAAASHSTKNLPAGNQSIHPSIKERPRRSTVLKEKPRAGAIQPKTRRVAEQVARTRTAPTGSPTPMGKKAATKRITERARKKAQQRAQQRAQRGMLQKSKQAAQATADLSKKAAQATVKAVKELISALAALVGGGTLAAAMCVIFLVAAVIASPFGILFANEPSPGAVPLNAAVNQINMELSDKLTALQSGDYSAIDIQGTAPDWREVAAVIS